MKYAVLVLIGFSILVSGVCYDVYINRNKEHVYSSEEVFSMNCSKRGGNPSIENGHDYTGDKDVRIQSYKCEGVK